MASMWRTGLTGVPEPKQDEENHHKFSHIGRPNMKSQSLRVCRRHFYSEVLWCGNQSICVWEAWGVAQKVLLQPKLGEEGVYVRERVVVQME